MTESLTRSLLSLRGSLTAAQTAAIEKHAPPDVCQPLTRSTSLLDRVLRMTSDMSPTQQLGLSCFAHMALTYAQEALLHWNAWIDAGQPSAR